MREQSFWVLATVCLITVAAVGTPSVVGAEPQSNFANIQVLTDLSDGDIQRLMQSWSQQLGGVSCTECHVQGDFASDDNPRKNVARTMARMVMSLDEGGFLEDVGREANCFLCHQGAFEIPDMN